ncbi:MAG: lysine--tRNA ligase [bacterium]|nr:lysine--tRNA ligase [bacterium]
MSLEELRKTKLDKLNLLKKAGVNPYPSKSWRTHKIKQALDDFDALAEEKRRLVLVGRVMAMRSHGASTFLDLEDGSGRIQSYLKKDVVSEYEYDLFVNSVEVGDFIEVSGFLFKTKKEEKTLEVEKYRVLSKALLPLPEKWHGLQDVEERFRKKYLDLIFNPEVKEKALLRSKIIQEIRNFLLQHEFVEVETPMLQNMAGGANAAPFKTHLNALDLDLYLRIAPELYLKRLLVGGFERIFEMNRNFRNEGMDREHNPEFTMLEFYAAYQDYQWMMSFTEELFRTLVAALFGEPVLEHASGKISFKEPFPRIEFNELLKKYSGLDYDEVDEEDLKKKAQELGITIEKKMSKGVIADEIYKKVARPNLINPIFVINHPLDISPLAKKLEKGSESSTVDSNHVARFQLLVGAMEVANGFSELNDPQDQRERFEMQEKNRERGDEDAQRLDEDFIESLEYGMPPAAGIGIGIDRLSVLLTNSHSIREVILFPLMKPK